MFGCGAPTPNRKSRVYEPKPAEEQVQGQINYLLNKIKSYPNDPEICFNLAQLYLRDDDLKAAELYFDKSLDNDTSDIAVVHLGVQIYNKGKNYTKAVDLGKEKINSSKVTSEFLTDLAWSYSMIGDAVKSTKCLGKAYRKTIKSDYLTGYNFLLEKDTANCLNQLKKVYDKSPSLPELYETLADVYLHSGQLTSLKLVLDKASNLGFNDMLLWKQEAAYYKLIGKEIEALNVYKKIITNDPAHYEANKLIATHYYEIGNASTHYQVRKNLDTCLIYFNNILEVATNEDLKIMAMSYKNLRRYDQALEYFKKVVEIAPNDSLAAVEIPRIVRSINYIAKLRQQPIDTIIQND